MKRICVVVLIVILMFVGIGVLREIVNIENEESWDSGDADANLNFQPGEYTLWEKDSKSASMHYWTEQSVYGNRNVCWAIVMDRLKMISRFEASPPTRKRTWIQRSSWVVDATKSYLYQNANKYYGVSDIIHYEHWWKCVPKGTTPGVTLEKSL